MYSLTRRTLAIAPMWSSRFWASLPKVLTIRSLVGESSYNMVASKRGERGITHAAFLLADLSAPMTTRDPRGQICRIAVE